MIVVQYVAIHGFFLSYVAVWRYGLHCLVAVCIKKFSNVHTTMQGSVKKKRMQISRRELTPEERGDQQRLRQAWERRKGELHLTQKDAAQAMGFKNQTAISQYITGRIPLNMEAAFKFAELLQVTVEELSPRFSLRATQATTTLLRLAVSSTSNLKFIEATTSAMSPNVMAGDLMVIDEGDLSGAGISLPTGRIVAIFTKNSIT